jgi:hypothetical protein
VRAVFRSRPASRSIATSFGAAAFGLPKGRQCTKNSPTSSTTAARLVAAYLDHADLSTVSRYAHVVENEVHDAAAALAARIVTRAPA